MPRPRPARAIATVSIALIFAASWVTADTAPPNAEQLIKTAGTPGGLVVHLGSGDGQLTAALRLDEGFVVHGLDADAGNVDKARRHINELGVYGDVSVERYDGESLPYADNLVNLIVVSDAAEVSRDEMMRVLTPTGVILERDGDAWKKTVKPWPSAMDQWTHYLHGPDGNPVGRDDLVGPPRHLQWIAGPRFSRGHEQTASFSSCVTAGGRMFYIVDEAPTVDIRMPAQWTLVARDAFNGVILWKRPMGAWIDHLRRFRSGPASLQFRLVASDNRLFVTTDFTGPVSILDAKTGDTLSVVKGSEFTKQIIHHDSDLYLVIDEQVNKHDEIDAARRRGEFIKRTCRVKKVNATTGETAWTHTVDELVFPSLAVRDGRVFVQTNKRIVCLDASGGAPEWDAEFGVTLPVSKGKLRTGEMQWEAPSLLVSDEAVYAADFKASVAYKVDTGEVLWTGKSRKGYNAPPDMHLVNGLFWMNEGGKRVGFDPLTGERKKEYNEVRGYMHDRCYRNKATENFFMLGKMGVQMIDTDSGEIWNSDWIRGTCQYGILPANGLLYVPPDSCACNMKTKLSGVYALAAQQQRGTPNKPAPVLEEGDAFGKTDTKATASDADWPTYRGAPGRNGLTQAKIGTTLEQEWKADIGGRLTAPVAAGDTVYVAAIDRHTVYALDIRSGETRWTFTAGGRIDSPPTIHNGVAYFGSADGRVYAVRAGDGALAWRLRVAPQNRYVMNYSQLESAWPVHGSVLIHKDALHVAAGRSSYLDGGIHLFRIAPDSGEVIESSVVFSVDKQGKQPTGGGKDVRGALTDVLLAQGDDVYMRHLKLDFAKGSDDAPADTHLFSPIGLLDDTWWHRAYWLISDRFQSHWSGWWKVGNTVPSGRILAYDDTVIYGFGRDKYPGGNTGQFRGGEKHHLFKVDRTAQPKAAAKPKIDRRGKRVKGTPKPQFTYAWTTDVPLLGTGLAVTPDVIFIAGPPDVAEPAGTTGHESLTLKEPERAVNAWLGKLGGVLYAASTKDGSKLGEWKLDTPPVFDGVAAARGRVFLSLRSGAVVSMTSKH